MTEVQSTGPSATRTWLARTAGIGLIAAAAVIGGTATADAAPASVLPDPTTGVITHGKNSEAALAACKAKTHGQTQIVSYLFHIPLTDRYAWACHPGLKPS
ncbi:hypothetical protein ACIA5G_52540 [Amycolatopsis sp. NPDC051758]|uniref:hypothetical protein n=1 Tax=Amycolatopsis sp. NPDC051758 TaxID=3363935 RepID=UPI00378CAC4E